MIRATLRQPSIIGAIVALALPVHPLTMSAQDHTSSGIHVMPRGQISRDNPGRPHFESHLAVDPNNPRHMVATSTVLEGEPVRSHVYVTFDGGRTWTRGRAVSGGEPIFTTGTGDALVYINRGGAAFFVASGKIKGKQTTLVARSTDGGRTWPSIVLLPYRDRPWLGFDETAYQGAYAEGPMDGTIYLGGVNITQGRDSGREPVLLLSRSYDDGKTFNRADLFLHDNAGPKPDAPLGLASLTDILVTPGGLLVMPYEGSATAFDTVGRALPEGVHPAHLNVLVSDDGGRTFGATRRGPILYSTSDYRGYRAFGAARAALDLSRGPHRDRLYVVRSDYDPTIPRYVIRLFRSDDFGTVWRTTIVNDDATGHDPANPAVAVSRDGIVAVIWNDRRDDPNGECWRLYGAISTDGGEHFLPNQKMSDAPTCTNLPGNWVMSSWYQLDDFTDPKHPLPGFGLTAFIPVRFPNGGDTQGLVADRDDVFHAAWIDGETGVMQLSLTDFSVESELVAAARAQNAQYASSAAAPPPAGRVDASQQLTFEMSDPKIDFAGHTLRVTMRIVNPTAHPVRGPIEIVLNGMGRPESKLMGFGKLHVANADTGGDGIGATWIFRGGPGGVVRSKGKSEPRVLRFSFEGGMPREPAGYVTPTFVIYSR